MKSLFFCCALFAALTLTTVDAAPARAGHPHYGGHRYGLHLATRNFHLDVGRPHGRYFNSHWAHGSYCAAHLSHRYHHPHGAVWHDATRWDLHRGGYFRHGNHYDYIRGHLDLHYDRHWDYYGGRGRW